MRVPDGGTRAADRRAGLVALVLCLGSLVFLGWQLRDGLGCISFMDEATHLVGGRMLLAGGLLYRDFIDSHGPLIFAIAQGYGALFGWSDTNGVRALIAACAVLAILSLGCSPAARTHQARACGLVVGCGLLATLWLRQGFYLFSFYPVAGALASIALSGFVAGACYGCFPRPAHAVAAGIACALLVGTAYSFLPSVACFALAACWSARAARQHRALCLFLAGLAAGLALMALWMARFADLHGYLSYHLAENQLVYSRYIDFGWRSFVIGLVPSVAPGARAQLVGLVCLLLALSGLAAQAVRRGPLLLVVLGVLELNARGATSFQNGAFLWAAITLLASTAMRFASGTRPRAQRAAAPLAALLVLAAFAVMRGALFLPFALPAQTIDALPRWPIGARSDAAFFALIRRYAGPGESILALPYQPQLYLLADRMPMDGFYAWFPWDQDYVRVARFGRGRDLCRTLAEQPPPVIVVDPSPFWGHPASVILPCLPAILRERYQADRSIADIHGTLYVRRDRLIQAPR